MSLDKNIAVFQSALHLAAKSGRLDNLKKNETKKIRTIIGDAGEEIIQGLIRDNSDDEKYNIGFKLLSVVIALSWKDDEGEVDEFWFPLINNLPKLSKDVLFEFVKDCDLGAQLFNMLSLLDSHIMNEIISDLATHLCDSTDASDRKLLLCICEHFFLVENPLVFKTDRDEMGTKRPVLSKENTELSREFNKLLQRRKRDTNVQKTHDASMLIVLTTVTKIFEETYAANAESFILFLCAANLFTCVSTGAGLTVPQLDFLQKPLDTFLKRSQFKPMFSVKDAKTYFVSTQDKYYTSEVVSRRNAQGIHGESISDTLKTLVENTCKPFLQFENLQEIVRLFANEDDLKDQGNVSSKNDTQRNHTHSVLLSTGYLCQMLSGVSQALLDEESFASVKVWCNRVALASQSKGLDVTLGERAWEWCIVSIKAKLKGNDELFSYCLNGKIPEKILPKWINCVEGNLSMINSSNVMFNWFMMLDIMIKSKHKPMTISSLRMLGLVAFKKLPLASQCDVIFEVHERLDTKRLFNNADQLKPRVTTTFNKLVKNPEDSEKSALLITDLLLQTPDETFRRMVDAAVRNKGQAKLMTDILKAMPKVCLIKSRSKTFLSRHVTEAVTMELSSVQAQNLLSFIDSLLYKSPKDNAYLISPVDLAIDVIFPNLSPQASQCVPISRILSVLRIILNKAKGEDWISNIHPVPLFVFLLEMLNSYCVLYDPEADPSKQESVLVKARIKERVLELIDMVQNLILEKQHCLNGKEISWLYNSLQRYHWIVPFYATRLLSSVDVAKFQMRIPDGLNSLIHIPDSWKRIPSPKLGSAYLHFFNLLRASNLASAMIHEVDKEATENPSSEKETYRDMLSALAMLLVQSVGVEWERIMKGLIALKKTGHFSYKNAVPHMPTSIHPQTEGVEDRLIVCLVFDNVLQVLSESVLGGRNPEVELHVAKCYVSCIKDLCLGQPSLDAYPARIKLYILAVHFCLICQQLKFFGDETSEPLYVLIMDILQIMSATLSALDKQKPGEGGKWKASHVDLLRNSVEQCPYVQKDVIMKTLLLEFAKGN